VQLLCFQDRGEWGGGYREVTQKCETGLGRPVSWSTRASTLQPVVPRGDPAGATLAGATLDLDAEFLAAFFADAFGAPWRLPDENDGGKVDAIHALHALAHLFGNEGVRGAHG
jgi:hypothetical protein